MTQEKSQSLKSQHESSLEEIMASNLFLPIGDDSLVDDYAHYIAYRAQRDLYHYCKRMGTISWPQFVSAMQHCEQARTAAAIVIRETAKRFFADSDFDFEAKDRPFYLADDLADAENETTTCCKLFETNEGRRLILSIILRAEIAHYRYQLSQGKDYSWEPYLSDVMQNGQLWNELVLGFRDALLRLDFKTVWQSDKLEGLVCEIETRKETVL